jgi:hypothetical protein
VLVDSLCQTCSVSGGEAIYQFHVAVELKHGYSLHDTDMIRA